MKAEERDHLKRKLEKLRAELLQGLSNVSSATKDDQGELPDLNDEAARSYQREVMHDLGESEREKLKFVEESLTMIAKEGSGYGICVDCGEDIPFQRLDAAPYVRRCIDCKSIHEENERAETT